MKMTHTFEKNIGQHVTGTSAWGKKTGTFAGTYHGVRSSEWDGEPVHFFTDGHINGVPQTTFAFPVEGVSKAEVIALAKSQIAADIAVGTVPSGVRDFGDLHDYIDANMYGGLCDGPLSAALGHEAWRDFCDDVQDALHAWLVRGRPATHLADAVAALRYDMALDDAPDPLPYLTVEGAAMYGTTPAEILAAYLKEDA